MVAIGQDHVVGWLVGWSMDHFAYEIALAGHNHVSDVGDVKDFGVL